MKKKESLCYDLNCFFCAFFSTSEFNFVEWDTCFCSFSQFFFLLRLIWFSILVMKRVEAPWVWTRLANIGLYWILSKMKWFSTYLILKKIFSWKMKKKDKSQAHYSTHRCHVSLNLLGWNRVSLQIWAKQ